MATVNSYTWAMPTPDRTSLDAIIHAARDLLESEGLAGVTMQAVAARVGVRAPSLYKRVRSRQDLIRLVAEATLGELADRVESAKTASDLLNGFRRFGKDRPAAFQLVMSPAPGTPMASEEATVASSATVLRIAEELAGEADALEAARTLTAWATGFIGMELSGSFRLGGDIERAWEFGVTRLVDAIREAHPSAGG